MIPTLLILLLMPLIAIAGYFDGLEATAALTVILTGFFLPFVGGVVEGAIEWLLRQISINIEFKGKAEAVLIWVIAGLVVWGASALSLGVYTDLGTLGILFNAVLIGLIANGWYSGWLKDVVDFIRHRFDLDKRPL